MTAVALVAAEGAESEHDTLLEELRAWKARPHGSAAKRRI